MHLPIARGFALFTFVVLATSFDGFAQANKPPTSTEKISALNRAYDTAVNNNDAAAVAALFTDDAVLVSDRGPIHGRTAIENWYSALFEILHPRNHIGTPDSDPHFGCFTGDEAWQNGEWSETEQVQSGPPIESRGYWSTIYSEDRDEWKIAMVIYNVTPTK